ncbi:MAG: M23 family metallopeptidase [Candidatus Korarchaeota archaeon]
MRPRKVVFVLVVVLLVLSIIGISLYILTSDVFLSLPDNPPEFSPIWDELNFCGLWGYGFQTHQGKLHPGIDFAPSRNYTFYACADGIVVLAYARVEDPHGYSVVLRVSKNIEVQYGFEPVIQNEPLPFTEEQMMEFIYVRKGDSVKAGQPIGMLVNINNSSHLHFGVKDIYKKVFISPIWFFNSTIRNELESYYESHFATNEYPYITVDWNWSEHLLIPDVPDRSSPGSRNMGYFKDTQWLTKNTTGFVLLKEISFGNLDSFNGNCLMGFECINITVDRSCKNPKIKFNAGVHHVPDKEYKYTIVYFYISKGGFWVSRII